MSDDNNSNISSNPLNTTETGKTEIQTDIHGKEFTISRVQDSKEDVKRPRLQG